MIEKIGGNYNRFINEYANFIIKLFSEVLFINKRDNNKQNVEQQIAQSLFLLEKLHMYLFHNLSYYEKPLSFQANNHPFYSNEQHSNYELFKRIKDIISNHKFTQDQIKKICIKTVSQILTYYPEESQTIKITIAPPSPPPLPWLPKH